MLLPVGPDSMANGSVEILAQMEEATFLRSKLLDACGEFQGQDGTEET